ncbi:MAG: peptidoglycan-binding protein [Myxococcales bacterium]|nr:peptidoglycan-binding protein [Myxococcales bacterium]
MTIRRLSVGSVGAPVRRLEQELKKRGLFKGPVDNAFDAKTKRAVQAFEKRRGFEQDGVVGARLSRLLGLGLPASKPGAGSEDAFDVVSMNVKANPLMSQDKVRHDVRRAAKSGELIGWQEIGPERYRDAIRDLKGFSHFMPKGLETPISWKTSEFKLLDSGVERMHGGLAGVSPHRQVAWVKLQNKQTGEVMIHMNTHLVSGAWNSKTQPSDPWRKAMWKRHIEKLGRLIERFEKQGYPVTISGDFNRNHFKVLGDKVVYASGLRGGTHGRSTLDYVMHTRNGGLKKLSTHIDRRYASDHNAVIVRYGYD